VLVDSGDPFTLRWEVRKTLELLPLGDMSVLLLSFLNLSNHTRSTTRLPIFRWMMDSMMRTFKLFDCTFFCFLFSVWGGGRAVIVPTFFFIALWESRRVVAFEVCDHARVDICMLSYMQAGPDDSLKDVALKILQNKVSTVPIIHFTSPDGSFPQLLHLASLSGILKCMFLPTANPVDLTLYNVSIHLILVFLIANYSPTLQVFADILNTVAVLCLFFSNQFVLFLWVRGFPRSGNQAGYHLLC